MYQIITDTFQKPLQLGYPAIFNKSENRFWYGKKSKKEYKNKQMKWVAVSAHEQNPVSGMVIDF